MIARVENGTERIETIIKSVLNCCKTEQDKLLLDAEATLDSAIKSASSLYNSNDKSSVSHIYPPLLSIVPIIY